jgi:CheY-like chemotaxis protein
VLYIEDNPANVEIVARYLSGRRHAHLASYPYGPEGYEYAAANRPDIILLDLPLEDLHGAQPLGRLKADPATADIPVVVLAADSSPGLIEGLFAAGALACLTKPLDLNEFGAILDSLPAPADIDSVPFVPPQGKPPTASEIDKYLA